MKEKQSLKFSAYDLRWTLSLFGTAVGAGILFLPIKAGAAGVLPVVVMAFLALPMAYLSHLALARFCNGTSVKEADITQASQEYFGKNVSLAITALYFFAFFPACIMYGVGITNTLMSFFANQLGYEASRFWVCFSIITLMMVVMILTEDIVIKVCEWLVYPLCAVLLLFSLYLIPHWNFSGILATAPSFSDFVLVVFFALPVLAFSFEHTPAISTFAAAMRRRYGEQSDAKCAQILWVNSLLLLFFIMFFVLSCVLSLSGEDFALAKEQNIPIVSYFANKFDEPLISYVAPLIAVLAIATSFFGHYFGAKEGLNALCVRAFERVTHKTPDKRKLQALSTIFFYAVMLSFSYLNPSILGIIDTLAGPIIAAVLFLLPLAGFYRVKKLAKYKNTAADIFVGVFGILTIITVIFKMF